MKAVPVPSAILLALAVCAAGFVASPPARADWVVLRNGQRIHVSGYERRGDTILFHLFGGEATLASTEVARIEPEDVFPVSKPSPANTPFSATVADAAARNGLDRHLLTSVIHAESDFQPRAVSPKGALGLMQLMPATARSLTVKNPLDPSENVQAGARYLHQLLDRFGSVNLALAAYNAGPQRVTRYHGIPPFRETRTYIARVRRGLQSSAKSPVAEPSTAGMVEVVCAPLHSACREVPLSSTLPAAPHP